MTRTRALLVGYRDTLRLSTLGRRPRKGELEEIGGAVKVFLLKNHYLEYWAAIASQGMNYLHLNYQASTMSAYEDTSTSSKLSFQVPS